MFLIVYIKNKKVNTAVFDWNKEEKVQLTQMFHKTQAFSSRNRGN